ncbi:MAG: replication factor C small subunit [Candidatus Aenigmatarchaeota archaeon]
MDTKFHIWTEKYRPKKLAEVVGQKHNTERLQALIDKRSLPHCIFSGPAGTGKTTTALCIAHELYGETWHNNFLELNASDERGIDTVRTKVKDFARTRPLGDNTFKIIYLDEADSLTKDAQHALRRTMEKYSETSRFILACNWSSRLISPIQSRAAVFRFKPLTKEEMTGFLKNISQKEDVSIDSEAIDAIIYLAEGDLRKAINILQTAASQDTRVSEETIYSTTSSADPEAVAKMLKFAISGSFEQARNVLLQLLIEQGLSGEDIVKEIHRQIFALDVPSKRKVDMMAKLGDYEFRLSEGANPLVQLEAMLAQFSVF